MNHTKQNALSMQLGWPVMPDASLAGTGAGRYIAPVLRTALELSRDGAARSLKPLGNLRDRELLVQQ